MLKNTDCSYRWTFVPEARYTRFDITLKTKGRNNLLSRYSFGPNLKMPIRLKHEGVAVSQIMPKQRKIVFIGENTLENFYLL